VLEHARRGIYGRNSFRSANLDFRERYFLRIEEGFQLSQMVRDRVNFRQGNLLAYGSNEGVYDVIFCRNLLIYFDEEAQDRAISSLDRLLAPDGLLFLGHAEIPLLTRRGFDSTDLHGAFACRKKSKTRKPPEKRQTILKGGVTTKPGEEPAKKRAFSPGIAATPSSSKASQIIKSHPLKSKPSHPAVKAIAEAAKVKAISDLDQASQLADRGRLQEAAELCIAHLRSHPDSASAHYLLGLTRDAAGKEKEAMDEYRRALYLDPNHAESLAHLASLLEKNGEAAAAQRLLGRVRRISSNG